ncbi:hypothetical protein SE15_05430 [Thermanaerothrix daxensis]|uniref:Uncharacterized protein n=1 Tax=Thermanaerothrix daxensis TaxID=869279 RepID=A0A0P6XWE0_9CHLR|nr:hypothetical protein [Thermanaerothrix daxensis]KPL84524.1 hypothetical protein SE15_05430 [Thermanaerothrix daxensis]
MDKPVLTFFCELETEPLVALFASPDLLTQLKDLGAGISLGILDLSSERAAVVQRLNREGIPVHAWLLLPKEQGYWFNLDNITQAYERYEQFKTWSRDNNLRWEAIGLDIEPDIRAIEYLRQSRWQGYWYLARQAFNRERGESGRRAYQFLVNRIRRDGYRVESYQIPLVVDERRAGSSLLQRLLGIVDLEVDREVLMLYSSFIRPVGDGYLWAYAFDAQAIGVGSTGGGVNLEGVANTRPLSWAELQRDLLLAFQHTDFIYIFSLEGCVQQNFLPLIRDLDWQQRPHLPIQTARQIERWRQLARLGLWMFAHPWVPAIALLVLLRMISRNRRK